MQMILANNLQVHGGGMPNKMMTRLADDALACDSGDKLIKIGGFTGCASGSI